MYDHNTLFHATLSCIYLLLCGLIAGALTTRIAAQNQLSYLLSSRLWNSIIKCASAVLVWKRCIKGCNYVGQMDLSSYPQNDMLEILFILTLRCFVFCISASFGSALQPVGLTGGIACGKSTLSSILRKTSDGSAQDAFVVIDLDTIAHDILVPGKLGVDCAYSSITHAFQGEDIFASDDQKNSRRGDDSHSSPLPRIDRRKLGDIIFHDVVKRRKLNSITHPLISRIMMKRIIKESFIPTHDNTSIVSVDIPLLFEVGLKMQIIFCIKVVIACSPENQLERLMKRNTDLTKEQCQSRIDSQMPVTKKVKMADIVIWNDGTMEELEVKVEEARREILSRMQPMFGITLVKAISIIYFIVIIVITQKSIIQ